MPVHPERPASLTLPVPAELCKLSNGHSRLAPRRQPTNKPPGSKEDQDSSQTTLAKKTRNQQQQRRPRQQPSNSSKEDKKPATAKMTKTAAKKLQQRRQETNNSKKNQDSFIKSINVCEDSLRSQTTAWLIKIYSQENDANQSLENMSLTVWCPNMTLSIVFVTVNACVFFLSG